MCGIAVAKLQCGHLLRPAASVAYAMLLPQLAKPAPLLASAGMYARSAPPLLILRGGMDVVTSKAIATAVGWTLSCTAMTIYTPIIASLVRERSVPASMSSTTWALQVLGFGIFVVYHVRMGFPLSTYVDFIALVVQSFSILVLMATYRKKFDAVIALPIAAIVAAIYAPTHALQALQVAATGVTTFGLVPQIVRNAQSRSRGGWSPYSGVIATGANAARIFTTLTLADANPLLLVQFVARCILNSVLLVQSLVWR